MLIYNGNLDAGEFVLQCSNTTMKIEQHNELHT